MDRDTELLLVGRLRGGDHAAFDAVYDEFHLRLHNFLARLSRRRDVADDLTEETWLRLVSHSDRLQPDTRLAPWLFTVARNLYVSYCRSRALDDSRESGGVGLWPTAPLAPSPFDEVAAGELERRVERGLAALPPRYREALLLVAVEGFSPSEAAAMCQVTPEALRQRLSRARTLLMREVDRRDEPVVETVLREVTP